MAETIRIEIPIETVDRTDPALSNVTRRLNDLGRAANSAGSNMDTARTRVSRFDDQADRTQKSLAKWAKEKYEVALEAKEKITPVLQKVSSGIKGIVGKTWNVTMKAIDLVTSPVRGIINLLRNPVLQAAGVLGVSVGLADTINTYKDFEAAMSQVQAISGATTSQLDQLTEKAKQMGATTKFTAEEAAEAFNYMAMAGWKTDDMMSGIEGILNLAAASGEDLGTTSDIVTDALTAFRMKAEDAGHFSDVLATAASNANTNVSMMGETFKYAGAMAGTLGYSIEDVALMTGLMANSGIKASMAGTALNMIFTRLSTNTGNATDALTDLGIAFFDEAGNARDLSDVMSELRKATADMNDEQRSNIANQIAGTGSQKGLLAILNASEEEYNKLADAIANADGASQDMADTMLDNLSGSITLLQSAVDGVKISFGERLAPYVKSVAEWLTSAMPAIQQGLDEFMDWVDRKADELKDKIDVMTSSEEWADADFFGKVQIAWDTIIAEPFSEWWNTTGKAKIAEISGDIGSGIGSALHTGIMMLLGIDVSDTANEGASVGAAFASGFAEGFDFSAVKDALFEGFKNLLSSAGKLMPGGAEADLGSIVSAALLAKVAGPAIGLGKGIWSVGKGLFGGQESLGGASLMGTILGSANAGTGLLGFGANTAIKLGAGNLAGGASMSAGMLSATGLGAVAGGAAGAASLISGGLDLYKAAKSKDEDYKAAYTESGTSKVVGVAAGAAAGAALGSVIPGLGTVVGGLLGAGIGGIAGWIHGNKVKEEYEENVEAAEEAAAKANKVFEATGFDIENTKFQTEALNQAIDDTEVSAEQLGQMFQEAVNDNLVSHFGDLHLSLREIKEAAEMIVFNGMTEQFEKFATVSQEASNSLATLKSDWMALDKSNWKMSLGTNLTQGDIDEYKATVEQMVKDAQSYLEDKHYEATLALKLLVGDDASTEGIDSTYSSLKSQLSDLSSQLSEAIDANIVMEDGVIKLNKTEEILSLQQQIADITNMVSSAEEEASFSAIKIKYGGAQLDAESFQSMQTELAGMVEQMQGQYDEALKVSLTNLQLELDTGAIDEAEYQSQLNEITEGYQANIDDLELRVESFQLDAIAEAYGEELDGILPDLKGTTAEKLQQALSEAMAEKPDVEAWTMEDVSGWFDLEGLDAEVQTAVGTMLQTTASSLPTKLQESIVSAMGEAQMDYTSVSTSVTSGISTAIDTADMTEINTAITTLKSNTDASVDAAFNAGVSTRMPVNVTLDYNVLNPTKTFTVSGNGASGSASITVSAKAAGGYVSGGPQLSWLAEEGYGEFVIPTNPSRRSRALELYMQAGEALGVTAHAEGGYVSGLYASNPDFISADINSLTNGQTNAPTGYNEPTEAVFETSPVYNPTSPTVVSKESPQPNIHVTVDMKPEFTIAGGTEQNDESIMAVIRRHMKEMADELGGEIADKLNDVFSNMPLKEA